MFVPSVMLVRQARGQGRQARVPQARARGDRADAGAELDRNGGRFRPAPRRGRTCQDKVDSLRFDRGNRSSCARSGQDSQRHRIGDENGGGIIYDLSTPSPLFWELIYLNTTNNRRAGKEFGGPAHTMKEPHNVSRCASKDESRCPGSVHTGKKCNRLRHAGVLLPELFCDDRLSHLSNAFLLDLLSHRHCFLP